MPRQTDWTNHPVTPAHPKQHGAHLPARDQANRPTRHHLDTVEALTQTYGRRLADGFRLLGGG